MREILHLLPKPSHYAGAEEGAIVKNPAGINLRVALAFPDTYEVGMSYLGQKILYGIVNARPRWQAERVMAPELEAARIMREHRIPLATLESDTPLSEMAAICFSVTHELCYTDILQMLDLAGIPLRQAERGDDLAACPVIMAGGGAMLGAEPLCPFIDLAALGDGEELLPEILECLEQARKEGLSRGEFLRRASVIPGVYVPSLFAPGPDGTMQPQKPGYRPRRRIVTDLDACPYPESQVAPVGAVHNRLSLEIARGCTRGCRFCHAGMVYRPARERSPEKMEELLDKCLAATGFDEVSFLALSAGDCTALKTIHASAYERCQKERITLGLPSLRVGSVDDDIMARMAALRRPGCTLAPEAGSQRLRDVINKGITEEQLALHVRKLLEHGWRQVKLYFMIGLPTETDADLDAIFDLAIRARDAGGQGAPRMRVTAAISPFVPKPFTPFQWEAQISLAEISRRVDYLRGKFRGAKNITLKWHEPGQSHLEGILSRGGRELADVVEKAFRKGALFCSWADHFDLEPWQEALRECGFNAEKLIAAREPGAPLPWGHIEAGISETFLLRERERALAGKTTADCRDGPCGLCGACDTTAGPSLLARTGEARHRLVFAKRDQSAHAPAADASGRLALRQAQSARPQMDAALGAQVMRYRLWHFKTDAAAWLSHLELQAVLLRALRRAGIPMAFSQGFHPLPLISFGRALPVGAQSEAEWFGVALRKPVGADRLKAALNAVLPAGLRIGHMETGAKKAELAISETFAAQPPEELMEEACKCFRQFCALQQKFITRATKKGEKSLDIRPLLLNWRLSVQGARQRIIFATDWSESYLSPMALLNNILEPLGDAAPGLVKLSQTFESGNVISAFGRQ